MTLFEVGASSGEISLAQLLAGEPARSADPGLTVVEIAREIAIGGWPGFRGLTLEQALRAVRDYLEEIRRVDVSRVEDERGDPRQGGTAAPKPRPQRRHYASVTTLARDTGGADGPLKDDTVRSYLDALGRLMIVEDQPPGPPI